MNDIQTTGGLFTEESRKAVIHNICKVFDCDESDIEELVPIQAGLTNVVLSFRLNGGKYVYRHPGLGSEILVERGRETIMQKIVEDAGIDTTLIAMDVDDGWRIGRFIEHWDFDYKNLNDIKECYRVYRGVATKYLNRYNALLSVAYRITAEKIRDCSARLLTTVYSRRSYTCHDVKTTGLLAV